MNNWSGKSLDQLVQRCRGSDEQAWRELLETVAPLIFSICRGAGLNRDEGFDVFGHVCYVLLRRFEHIRSPGRLLAYVAQITRHEAYALRRKAQAVVLLDDNQLEAFSPNEDAAPDIVYQRARRTETLMKALAQLPDRDQMLIRTLFLGKNKPDYQEASEQTGIPVPSIGPTRARCLQKLYRLLKRKGYDFDR